MRHFSIWLAAATLLANSTFAEHNALLPRPQQLRYAEGALPLSGLSIRFAAQPSAEDRFAAEQLAARLSAVSQTRIALGNKKLSGRAIVLNRTGEAGTLPGANESPGPDSRESYSLQMTAKGAEIRAASSAGIFYGVQTLLQMLEGEGKQAVLPAAEIHDWPALA